MRYVFVFILVVAVGAGVVVYAQDGTATPTNLERLIASATAQAAGGDSSPTQIPSPTQVPIIEATPTSTVIPTLSQREAIALTATAAAGSGGNQADEFELTATALVAGATATAFSQQAQPAIPDDSTITAMDELYFGELDAANPEYSHEFTVAGAATVDIAVTSGDFDTFLRLFDASGTLLVEDDDGNIGTNSAIEDYSLSAGTYTVVVTSYGAAFESSPESGPFELSIIYQLDSASPDVTTTTDIDETFSGQLTIEQPEMSYEFDFEAGVAMTINVTSDEFDTYLEIRDGTGSVIQEDDDSGVDTNSSLPQFVAPVTGTYTVVVTSYGAKYGGGADSGSFELTVTTAEPSPVLAYGETLTDRLTLELGYFNFEGQAGDLVVVQVHSNDFEPYLELYKDQDYITYGYADNTGNSALMGPYELTESGTYTINLSNYTFGGGEFTMTLDRVSPTTAAIGTPFSVQLTAEQPIQVVEFAGGANDALDISVKGTNASVILKGPYDSQLYAGELRETQPQIQGVYLDYDGTYRLVLVAEPDTSGSIGVSIETAAIPVLAHNEPMTVMFSEEVSERRVVFDVQEGERVQITISPVEVDDYWDMSADVIQDDNYLSYYSFNGVDSAIFTHTFEDAGEVTLSMNSYSYDDGGSTFTVELRRLSNE